MSTEKKEQYAKSICLFLAELLRTRKVALKRAAEIAQKVADHLNLVDSEQDFLKLIKELTYDFEELFTLGERITLHVNSDKRREMESVVRQFVVNNMAVDTPLAVSVLKAAIEENTKVDDLCLKFPEFKQFMLAKNHGTRI